MLVNLVDDSHDIDVSNFSEKEKDIYESGIKTLNYVRRLERHFSSLSVKGLVKDFKNLYSSGGIYFNEFIVESFKESGEILIKALKTGNPIKVLHAIYESCSKILEGFQSFFTQFPNIVKFIELTAQVALAATIVVYAPYLLPFLPVLEIAMVAGIEFFTLNDKYSNTSVEKIKLQRQVKKLSGIVDLDTVQEITKNLLIIQNIINKNISKDKHFDAIDFFQLGLFPGQLKVLAKPNADPDQLREFYDLAKKFKDSYELSATNNPLIPPEKGSVNLNSKMYAVLQDYVDDLQNHKAASLKDQITAVIEADKKLIQQLRAWRFDAPKHADSESLLSKGFSRGGEDTPKLIKQLKTQSLNLDSNANIQEINSPYDIDILQSQIRLQQESLNCKKGELLRHPISKALGLDTKPSSRSAKKSGKINTSWAIK